jgi:hypothetical protein
MSKKLKPAWAIIHWVDGVYLDTIRPTRKDAIKAFRDNYKTTSDWHPCSPSEPNKACKVEVMGDWRT